jgi:hypothetical protein
MILGKEKLDINYWSKHLPMEIEITPWERKQLNQYFIEDLCMSNDHNLDFDSDQLKMMIDYSRKQSYNLSGFN